MTFVPGCRRTRPRTHTRTHPRTRTRNGFRLFPCTKTSTVGLRASARVRSSVVKQSEALPRGHFLETDLSERGMNVDGAHRARASFRNRRAGGSRMISLIRRSHIRTGPAILSLLGLVAAGIIAGCGGGGGGGSASNAMTENDFAADTSAVADPDEGIVVD